MATTPSVKSEYYLDPVEGQRYVMTKPGGTTDPSGNPAANVVIGGALANERNIASSTNAYGVGVGEWNHTMFNPRAASIGAAVGAAGAAGATEVLIGAGAPILLGGITFESDSAGTALLRNASSTGQSVSAHQVDANVQYDGQRYNVGLTAVGSVAGTAFIVKWRLQ